MYVVKIGGAAGIDAAAVCADLAAHWRAGQRLVLMHGGSAATDQLAVALGHPPCFVTSASGQVSRRTDPRTLEIFIMATAAINRRLVAALQAQGVNALGLCGLDGRLIQARRKPAIRVIEDGRERVIRDDWTGTPTTANGALLRSLLDAGYLPVVAPLAAGAPGEALNIDGDRGAALLAGTLRAEALILLTNVPGLLRHYPDEQTLIPHVPGAALEAMTAHAAGRMRKKLLGAAEALAAGVPRVIIAAGRGAAPLGAALAGGGTLIGAARTPQTPSYAGAERTPHEHSYA
ncbi:MAG TPA: [LysW]-aminoadipate kinase [Chloroflexia bacterium]|nr:[LysW]-aminoadipate kinase [Chloroflexia bacterium]